MRIVSLLPLATAISLVSAAQLRRGTSPQNSSSTTSSVNIDEHHAGSSSTSFISSSSIALPQHLMPDAAPLAIYGLLGSGGPSSDHSVSPPLIPQAASEINVFAKGVHFLAKNGKLIEMEQWLEREPPAVAARDAHGWTPLHEAARGAHLEMISLLLDHGAELNAMTYTGATPLYEAEKYNGKDSAVFRYLLSLGAIRSEARAQLRGKAAELQTREEILEQRIPHDFAAKGHMDELNQLATLRGSWVLAAADDNGWTPLHEAARSGHVHVARFLIEHGVSVNTLSSEGGTPAYYATLVQGEDSDIVKFLLSQGGDSNGPSSSSL